MKTFEELGLSDETIKVLSKLKIQTPSEIQEKTIPLVLAGNDVIGGSATGSGKTLAFASSIIEKLEKNKNVQALILTPTRELAEQVANAVEKFSKHKKINVLSIYGGVSIETQIRRLKNTDVVVGTPGRILDHLSRRTLDLSEVRFLVLDEVDRMFDMGFQIDVEKILSQCPEQRQTMLFSATISSEMDHLATKHTKKPIEVSVESHVDASKLKQIYYDVPDGLKFSLFVHLLKNEKAKLVMVFCGTRRNVDFVTDNLNNLGIKAKAIHGGLNQSKRNSVLSEFNSEKGVNVLVCTDVAARGLDIREVSHVYNYDLPKASDDYIHRIGRTARAGKDGIAINVLCSRDYDNFNNILRDEQIKIEAVKTPWFEKVRIIINPRDSRGSDNNRGRSFGRGRGDGRRDNRSRSSSGNRGFSRGRNQSRGSGSSRGSNNSSGSDNRNRGSNSYGRGRPSSGRNDSRGSDNSRGRSDNRKRKNYGNKPRRR